MRSFLGMAFLVPFIAYAQVPESIVQDRSLVILDFPLQHSSGFEVRGEWKETADEVQSMLKIINVDAVGYLHADDWQASPDVNLSYRLFFAARNIQNLIRLGQEGNLITLSVLDFKSQNELWSTEAGSVRQAVIRLGNEIKKKNFDVENFLPMDRAEVFVDIPFSRWSASSTYPDQIKRLTIGVAKFPDDAENARLKSLMDQYPFKYELFEYKDDEDAFRNGYQYVLLNITTSGSTIRQLLNLDTEIMETDFISTVKGDSSSVKLKTIPADARVTKFFIKQTVNKEIFVGKNWDADVDWEKSLENFIHNLRIAFKKI